MQKLSMKERILAVIKGQKLDKVPFVQYNNLTAPNRDVWQIIGRENMGILKLCRPYKIENKRCTVTAMKTEYNGRQAWQTIIETPLGNLSEVKVLTPIYGNTSIEEFFIKSIEDYPKVAFYFNDMVISHDPQVLEKDRLELGDDGIPFIALPRTPFQKLWIEWVNLNNFCMDLFDKPDVVAECVDVMIKTDEKIYEVVSEADVDVVDFLDNITAPLIGVENFRKYCLPCYQKMASLFKGKNVPVFVHMDGDIKPLWKDISKSSIRGLDSFSPPPDNDTSAGQAVEMWPEMRLFLNFPSSIHLEDEKTIYNKAIEILQQAGHTGRLQIQISENVPADMWQKSFPQIIKAINDFGEPGKC